MSDAQSLLLLLLLLYLSDCLWWLPWNSCVLDSARPGGRWRWRVGGHVSSNQRGSLVFLWPYPLSVALQLDPLPFTFAPTGLLAWSSVAWSSMGRPKLPGWICCWKDIESIAVIGHKVQVDGRDLHEFSMPSTARRAAALLEGLRTATYRRKVSECSECPGITLVDFEPTATTDTGVVQ